MNHIRILVIGLIIISAGCASIEGTPRPTTNPVIQVPTIDIEIRGENNTLINDSSFYYHGEVQILVATGKHTVFNDVMICLYDSEWNVLDFENVGSFESGARTVEVEFESESPAKYLVVEHPNFSKWNPSGGVLVRDEGYVLLRDRAWLDRAPPTEAGSCR